MKLAFVKLVFEKSTSEIFEFEKLDCVKFWFLKSHPIIEFDPKLIPSKSPTL